MKKWLIVAVAMFAFCNVNLCAFSNFYLLPDRSSVAEASIVANPSVSGSKGYFVVTNGEYPTYWEVFAPILENKNFEFFGNFMPISSSWKSSPKDWSPGSRIRIIFKAGNLDFLEDDASNQSDLKSCTHIFINNNGEKLVARHMDIGIFLESLYNHGYNRGCQKNKKH